MTEVQTLIRAVSFALTSIVTGPEAHARFYPSGAFALSGEMLASFNQAIVGPGGDPQELLTDAVMAAKARGLPLLANIAAGVAPDLADIAGALGMESHGLAPLMVFDADRPLAVSRTVEVARALTGDEVATAGEIVASAFNLPAEPSLRFMTACADQNGLAEVYLARRAGQAMSSVTVTRTGSMLGVWNMATPVEHQGQGVGRALLSQVLERMIEQGARRFYLIASAAGRPLYESLGFVTATDLSGWVLPANPSAS